MFTELIRRYDSYIEAQKTKPYNPDVVQGRGMYFHDEWTRLKVEICQLLGTNEDDFSYNKYRLWMALIKRAVV